MFGDKPIAGYQTGKVDDKSRTIIPKFTGVEPNDELALIQEDEELYIFSTKKLNETYEKLTQTPSEENLTLLKELRKVCENIIQISSVDKQGRFTLGRNIKFDDTTVEFVGSADRLKIEGKYTLTKKRCK